jgi:large subunit ribosomal protein L29
MATETLKEYRKMAADELAHKESELRGELFKLRTGGATEKVKDTSKTGKLKKDIARIKTLLRERELENSKKAQA